MIDGLIRWCLKNTFLVVIARRGASCSAATTRSTNTPVDAIPDIGEKQVIVFADWPGRSPQDVDNQVTYPLTDEPHRHARREDHPLACRASASRWSSSSSRTRWITTGRGRACWNG